MTRVMDQDKLNIVPMT